MPPSNVSTECANQMDQSDKDFWNWTVFWIGGREFYRQNGKAYMDKWDQVATKTPISQGSQMSDGNALCNAFLADLGSATKGYLPGWTNSACALDLPAFACFANAFSQLQPAQRASAVTVMKSGNVPAGFDPNTLAFLCSSDIKNDPYYGGGLKPPPGMTCPPGTTLDPITGTCAAGTTPQTGFCPQGQLPNPLKFGACDTPPTCGTGQMFNPLTWSCQGGGTPATTCPQGQLPNPTKNGACETPPSCPAGQVFDPQGWICQQAGPPLPGCPQGQIPNPTKGNACEAPLSCPQGQVFNTQAWQCQASGVTPVNVKEDTETKINWPLWGAIGAVVIGGAALLGSLRSPEYVVASPNPRGKKHTRFKTFEHHGPYLTLIGTETGGLILRPTQEGIEEAREMLANRESRGRDIIYDQSEMLEWHIGNGWDYVRPEEIGALTDATIISQEADRDDQGDLVKLGRVYAHMNYAVEDPIETWAAGRDVFFQGA